jgi:aminopeptidase N
VRFTATDVTDFAFAASPDFRTTTAQAAGAEVVLYYMPEHEGLVGEYMAAATGSLEAFSDWYGPYPHPRLTVVDVPQTAQGAGGMEYPTLITGGTIGLPPDSGAVSLVTAHEVGHQWWPMQTATNEGREPWLDEGLTEYSSTRYLAEADRGLEFGPAAISAANYARSSYATDPVVPANLSAWEYDGNYGVAVYNKPAVGLWTLENVVGTEAMRDAMADYLEAYRFKHPTASDFRRSLETSLNKDLAWFFDDFIAGTGVIDYAVAGIETTATGSTVTLQRQGEVRAPVDVQVTRASGVQETEVWDGATETTSLSFDATDPVVMVEIDPEQKLVAELDVLDNGRTAGAQVVPALTLGGRLSFWLQTLLNMLGLMG